MNACNSTKFPVRIASALALGVLVTVLSGCFQGLRRDMKLFENAGMARGHIRGMSSEDTPVTVIAYREHNHRMRIYAYTMSAGDRFFFILAGDQDYYFVGFEDKNNNRVLDDGELAGAVGSPDPVRLVKEGRSKHIRRNLRNRARFIGWTYVGGPRGGSRCG
jgi:hypothetical protein